MKNTYICNFSETELVFRQSNDILFNWGGHFMFSAELSPKPTSEPVPTLDSREWWGFTGPQIYSSVWMSVGVSSRWQHVTANSCQATPWSVQRGKPIPLLQKTKGLFLVQEVFCEGSRPKQPPWKEIQDFQPCQRSFLALDTAQGQG